jgi:KDO2-lipid IV(A) lauroyltransferase
MNKNYKNKFETALLKLTLLVFRFIPYKVIEILLTNLFVIIGYYIGFRKKLSKKQLRFAFPEKSNKGLNRIVKRMYYLLGLTSAQTYFGDQEKLIKETKLIGLENIEKAASYGKGVILVSGHMGNWELGAKAKSKLGYKLSVIIKKQRNEFFDNLTNQYRFKYNIDVIYKKKALRPILKAIAAKHIVCFVADQNARKDGIRLDVFGKPASVFVGWAKIAAKTGSPIVPAFAYHDKDNVNCYEYLEPIFPPEKATKHQIHDMVRQISALTEVYAKKYPSDWFWVHKRWKGAHQAHPAE